jgi:hypothetical protein
VQTADGVNTIVAAGATGLVRIGGYITSKSASAIEALNTAETAFTPLWIGGSILQFAASGSEAARIDASGNLTAQHVPATVGTNNRSLGNRFAELFNVFDFLTAAQITSIQTGGGGTDTTLHANINTALATASATGCYNVYFPPGIYNLYGQIYFNSAGSVSMVGAGTRQTVLNFMSNTVGAAGVLLQMQQGPSGDYRYLANVRGFTIRTGVNQSVGVGNTALAIAFPAQASGLTINATVENVEIDGGPENTYYWTRGIYFNYGWQGSIFNCDIRGRDDNWRSTGYISTSNMIDGIKIDGTSGNQGSDEVTIQSCTVVYSQTAINIVQDSEGCKIDNSALVAVNIGTDWIGGSNHPSIRMSNTHMATFTTGVRLGGVAQVEVINNLFYKNDYSTQNWTGVYLGTVSSVGTTESIISNNLFSGQKGVAPGGTAVAIGVAPPSSPNLIANNLGFNLNQFADLASTTYTNYFFNNILYNTTNWLANGGSAAIMVNNQPLNIGSDTGYSTLTPVYAGGSSGPATSSVGSANGNTFYTNNSTATSFTDFVNNYVGQTLNIVAADSNTTVKHNAGMILKGGVDFVMAIGNTLTLVRATASVWREFARTA